MRAVVWEKPGELKVTEVADPAPGHGELVVQVGACGICGTDLHIADGEFPPTPYPIIPGHEFAGRVVAIGDGAPGEWRGGERVAVDRRCSAGTAGVSRAGRPCARTGTRSGTPSTALRRVRPGGQRLLPAGQRGRPAGRPDRAAILRGAAPHQAVLGEDVC